MGDVFGIENFEIPHRFFVKEKARLRNPGSFYILSSLFLNNLNSDFFDETFINGCEDLDFALRHLKTNTNYINFSIADLGGISLGDSTTLRFVWDIANRIYLTDKYNTHIYD